MTGASQQSPGDMLKTEIVMKVLENPFNALAQSPPNALGIIFFAMLTGLACLGLGEQARPVTEFFRSFNEVMMKITLWFMEVAPFAIGCLIASVVAELGMDAFNRWRGTARRLSAAF
jgi:Na+/H+-dicarboxylate symporter